jgi:hypothetical protein
MPNDEPGLPRNAYASEGFSMMGFCGSPKLPGKFLRAGSRS